MMVRDTVHLSLSNFPVASRSCVLKSYLYSKKTTVNSHRAILPHVNASLEFLKLVRPQNKLAAKSQNQ